MVASESLRAICVMARPSVRREAVLRRRSRQGKRTANRENTLFCQRPVQKVEPILTPERLVAIDVRRRAEDLAVDRLLRQRVVARADVGCSGAFGQRLGVESLLGCDRGQRVAFRDVRAPRPRPRATARRSA